MEAPIRPDDSDCCNSGCNPCIFDVYEEQLVKYEKKLLQTDLRENYISQTKYKPFLLTKAEQHAKDCFLFTFCIQDSSAKIFWKPGQHFLLRGEDRQNKNFTRAYTPIPLTKEANAFMVLIKLYENGKMSDLLRTKQIGEVTLWRGPYGNYDFKFHWKYLLCVAQGTGIAPIFAVLDAVLKTDECEGFVKLFYCCRNFEGIFLREYLYSLTRNWNFTYEVFLSCSGNGLVKYNEVIRNCRLSREFLKDYLEGKLSEKIQVLICGSKEFSGSIKEHVLDCGLSENDVYVF